LAAKWSNFSEMKAQFKGLNERLDNVRDVASALPAAIGVAMHDNSQQTRIRLRA
jgi:hypothetical protein